MSDFYGQMRAQGRRKKRRRRSGIHINPAHAGRLRAKAKTKGGKIPVSELQRLKNSPNPATRKQATFALNARSWGH